MHLLYFPFLNTVLYYILLFYNTLGTPLEYACRSNSVRATELLLQHGAHPDHWTASSTPLLCAAQHGSEDIISALLEYGADLTIRPKGKQVVGTSLAFYVACLRGNFRAIIPFLSAITEADICPISYEHMILCQTILGIQLLQHPEHVQVGLTIWRKALESFNVLVKPEFGELGKVELSYLLFNLYLEQSVLVQSEKTAATEDKILLKRTRSRFPDFMLCVSPDDITEDFYASHHTVIVHNIILKSCVSVFESWWSYSVGLSINDSVISVINDDIPAEKKRLCLLIVLENAMYLCQEMQIMFVNHNMLVEAITRCKLYVNNPGYLMLIMDVNIEVVETTFQSWSNPLMESQRKQKKYIMVSGFERTSEVIATLAFLVLSCATATNEQAYLTKLLHTYIKLCKHIKSIDPSIGMEFHVLNPVIKHMAEEDPLELKQHDDYSDPKEALMELSQLLFRCGVDANARDANGNTVMFTAMKLEEPHRSNMIELLMSHQAHVDVTNNTGKSPYALLSTLTDCRIHPLECRTLRCRAASMVSFYKIPYQDKLPKVLEEFVELHDTHLPTNPFT